MYLKANFIFLIFISSHFVHAQSKINPVEYKNDPIKVKCYTLENGLQVFLTENHDSPNVFGGVVVKAGGKTDPAHATGMAHYLEHMLFKGTTTLGTTDYEKEKLHLDSINVLYEELAKTKDETKRKNIQKKINEVSVRAAQYAIPNEMDRMLSEIGGEDVNAFTDLEMTVYHNSFPASQMERWLDIYAHRFQNPVFRLFQSELEIVYEEKNIGMDDPMESLFEKFMVNFYKVHPYGQQTIIGTTEHLKNPSLKTMYEYFDKYYVPNNMALVISGDFDSEATIKMIEEKFGKWKRKDVEKFPEYKEKEFDGKEKVRVRYTPVKVGALGYRSPSNANPDYLAVEIISNMLSNGNGGFIDELSDQGKIMAAGLYYEPKNDYGHAVLYFIPKIIGQSLKKAEKLVYAQIQKIQNGDFTDEYLQAVKNNIMMDWEYMKEYNEDRALEIATAFASNKDWGEYLVERNSIRNITREQVMEAAKKYFGENCLSMHSKMGFSKKDKLPKPGFQPVKPKEGAHSQYYDEWKKIPKEEKPSRFVDFEKDVTEKEIVPGVRLSSSVNPFNSIFSMKMKFGTGKFYDKHLKILPYYLNIADSYVSSAEFKRELYALGCSVNFSVNDYQFTISVEGLEENLGTAMQKIYKFITEIKPDEAKIKKIVSDLKAEQKLNDRSPQWKSQALSGFVNFGENSFYLTELSVSEISKVKAATVIQSLKDAMNYEVKITFAGEKPLDLTGKTILSGFKFNQDLKKSQQRVFRTRNLASENTIYILNDKKARQSQVNFFIDGNPFEMTQLPVVYSFNKYFGGDMSSLVFQEIRELRSLAYSTYGTYQTAYLPGNKNHFSAFVGCQADKTNDAIAAMYELIHQMPEKSERMDGIRSSMVEESKASRPGFRRLAEVIEAWKERGFTKDANQTLMEEYEKMTFDKILEFYKKEIQNKTTIITIVGDKSKFDLEGLKKYGKVVEVQMDQITKK
jgi:predicted Zn-dependent peptidase